MLVCISDANKRSTMFQILKEKDEKDYISDIRLLKKKKNRKDLEVENDFTHDNDPPMHSFSITEAEYGDYQDNYAQVSNKMIKVYDKQMNLRLRFEGLKIRHCEDVH